MHCWILFSYSLQLIQIDSKAFQNWFEKQLINFNDKVFRTIHINKAIFSALHSLQWNNKTKWWKKKSKIQSIFSFFLHEFCSHIDFMIECFFSVSITKIIMDENKHFVDFLVFFFPSESRKDPLFHSGILKLCANIFKGAFRTKKKKMHTHIERNIAGC